jgi:hypothetical protein
MLAGLEATHTLAAHLGCLQSLQVSELKRIEALSTEHLGLHQNLALGKLNQLGLAGVLEIAKRAN